MKKVIILCSALVFNFLTCSDASAYNAKFEAATIEEKLTELISLANTENAQKEMVQYYADKIKELVNSRPQKWMGSGDLKIVGNRVEFIGPFNQPHQGKNRIGQAEAQKIISEIQEEIDLLKAQHHETANLIPWSSQNSSSGRDYAENNRIEGENSRLALPAPHGNSENQRPQVEGGNSENSEANSSAPSISRRSSVSSTNSKSSSADYQYDSSSESSSDNVNGFGSTFSNHYKDSLFDN